MTTECQTPEDITARAREVLRAVFGFDRFRGHQEAIIRQVTAGGDAFVLMPTGGGKSLCYQLPALLRPGVGVVVSPLIALMQDQVSAMRQLGVRAAFLNSTLSLAEAQAVEEQVQAGELDLLYVAPERLLTDRTLALLTRSRISLFADAEILAKYPWYPAIREALESGVARPRTLYWAEMETTMGSFVQEALIGQKTPEEALNEANAKLVQILK